MKVLIFLTLVLFQNSYAKQFAEVVILKGKATKLEPHAQVASELKLNEKIIEDTSILTEARSFVRLKFADGSMLNIGPESKIVLSEIQDNSVNLISLLKGKIRSQVIKDQKSQNDKNKLLIKTQTAALGVRGTEFQAIFNPENRVTSLITFKGSVALAKIDRHTQNKLEQLENTDAANSRSGIVQTNSINNLLTSDKTVIVESGQYAGTSEALARSTLPVKINPLQFESLLKNDELSEKTTKLNSNKLDLASTEVLNMMKTPSTDPNGVDDKTTGAYAPRAGGVVDINTGLYIAPEDNAPYDDKNKVYLSQNIGSIDKETGQYLPPVGFKLDSKKGFIPLKENENNPEVIKKQQQLNTDSLKREKVLGIVVPKIKTLDDKFLKDELFFSLTSGGMHKDISSGENKTSLDANSYTLLNLSWKMRSTFKIRPVLDFGMKHLEFNQNSVNQGYRTLFNFSIGAVYAYSMNLNFITSFGINQNSFAALSDTTSNRYDFVKMGHTEFGLGADYTYNINDHFYLYTKVLPYLSFKRDLANVGSKMALGLNIELASFYQWEIHAIGVGLKMNSIKKEVTSQNQLNSTKDSTSESGLSLIYKYTF